MISVLPELVFQPLLVDDFGASGISFFGFVDWFFGFLLIPVLRRRREVAGGKGGTGCFPVRLVVGKEDRREEARRPYLCRDPVVDRRSSGVGEDFGAVFGTRFSEQWIRFLCLDIGKKRNPGIFPVWPTTVGARGRQ
ncbi:hypothetical protein U1Q18_031795 [Sarracenia purpurea var. burkii]